MFRSKKEGNRLHISCHYPTSFSPILVNICLREKGEGCNQNTTVCFLQCAPESRPVSRKTNNRAKRSPHDSPLQKCNSPNPKLHLCISPKQKIPHMVQCIPYCHRPVRGQAHPIQKTADISAPKIHKTTENPSIGRETEIEFKI